MMILDRGKELLIDIDEISGLKSAIFLLPSLPLRLFVKLEDDVLLSSLTLWISIVYRPCQTTKNSLQVSSICPCTLQVNVLMPLTLAILDPIPLAAHLQAILLHV